MYSDSQPIQVVQGDDFTKIHCHVIILYNVIVKLNNICIDINFALSLAVVSYSS